MTSGTKRTTGADDPPPRRRLARGDRRRQLVEQAWSLVREDGTDALTLGRLATAAHVAKPVVYSHFASREALLVALYEDFDAVQTTRFDAALAAAPADAGVLADTIARCYIDCVLAQGREIPHVLGALTGSPALAASLRDFQHAFIGKCRAVLAPVSAKGHPRDPALWAIVGAADALSRAAAEGELSAAAAQAALRDVIVDACAPRQR